MVADRVQRSFPALLAARPVLTSFWTGRYNCIAWAAGDTERWWWPDAFGQCYWPEGAPRREDLQSFIAAFSALGYRPCALEDRDPSFERVALFCEARGAPLHAARLLPSGAWTSKLGEQVDIEHELEAVEGPAYGRVAAVLYRSWPGASPSPRP